jgi:hypothetical protein
METTKDALDFVTEAMAFASHHLVERGCLRPMTVLKITRDPQSRDPLPHPAVLPIVYGESAPTYAAEQRAKDEFAAFVRSLAVDAGAVGVIFMAESWMLFAKDAGDLKKATKRGLSEHPDRKECVFITLEHRAFPGEVKTWVGMIERDSSGSPRIAEFQEQPGQAGYEGRFVNILPPLH